MRRRYEADLLGAAPDRYGRDVRRAATWAAEYGRKALLLVFGLVAAWYAGRSIAGGGRIEILVLAIAGGVVAFLLANLLVGRRMQTGVLALEVPVLLVLTSTLVFRGRSASALAANPLDSAAQVRVLSVSAAAFLSGASLLSRRRAASARKPLTSLPIRMYMAYVVVAFVGAVFSLKPLLTYYRVYELAAGLLVLLAAYRRFGREATARIEAAMYWFTVAVLASVWIGLAVAPKRALDVPLNQAIPIKWELTGVWPAMAANTVGALGALLAIWSLARLVSGERGRQAHRLTAVIAIIAALSVIAAQYRTGYGELAVGTLVLLGLRRKPLLVLFALFLAVVVFWRPTLIKSSQPYVLRGQSVQDASQLSGRVDFWRAALPVWKESPIIGRGLLTASRFEVLQPLGFDLTASIHSTWIEALVGTGLLGTTLLALALLIGLSRAWREAHRTGGAVLPFALLAVLTVRSLTGNALESFSHEGFIFLAILMSLTAQHRARPIPPPRPGRRVRDTRRPLAAVPARAAS